MDDDLREEMDYVKNDKIKIFKSIKQIVDCKKHLEQTRSFSEEERNNFELLDEQLENCKNIWRELDERKLELENRQN